jgi:adenine-specific DNA-methyltransferase
VAETYRHYDASSPMRPEIGTQPQFRKKKAPITYRYDSSLSPALQWDGQNASREVGEWLLALVAEAATLKPPHGFDRPREFKGNAGAVLLSVSSLHDAVEQLRRLGRPFLDWAGKAERLSFDVPTLPLFIHERLSTKAIIETLTSHKRDKQQTLYELFADPQHPITDQTLRAYEYPDQWVNRLILGDSLVVMNSLLHYEGLGGQVQMIYMDPPYGVRFGSNFQPFVRRRDVSHNDDADMTREPEMVKAYRDTWELGLHSYLTFIRDRLLLCRDLLTPSGSVFLQISDDNVHHVRELIDEVFGADNHCGLITFTKTGGATPRLLPSIADYILWYAKDRSRVKYRQLYVPRPPIDNPTERYICVETSDGRIVDLSVAQKLGREPMPEGRILVLAQTTSPGSSPDSSTPVVLDGKSYYTPPGRHWTVTAAGMQRVANMGRAFAVGKTLRWKSYRDDYPFRTIDNNWEDVSVSGFGTDKLYVVQTTPMVIQRCMLMSTDPGDLVLDPTCGSGTTAYVAEHWGRRWITIDTSRVPLALTRQRLLTATFPYYSLADDTRGPAGGFIFERKKNRRGEEIGGIVPHMTLKSIANDELPDEEVLVDRPEVDHGPVRVTGPFTVDATIPRPTDWDTDDVTASIQVPEEASGAYGSFVERMLEVLRRSPVFHLGRGKSVTVHNVRRPAKTLSLAAEAIVVNGQQQLVAFVFGPEDGGLTQMAVHEALREASLKGYAHLYAIGFAIQPDARLLIERSAEMGLTPATYVQATPDLMMGDLLKNMRSSQIFSVCGLPEARVHRLKDGKYEAELIGLDTFDPATMQPDHRAGSDVPAWFLDTNYNGLCFHVCQAFFPRTAAWDDLRRALRGTYDDTVWDHLAGTVSAPFEAGEHGQVAIKVIDDRGNELLVVKSLRDAEA